MTQDDEERRIPVGDVVSAIGLPLSTLNGWRKRGLLGPIGEGRGSTYHRMYSFKEALAFAIMRELTAPPMAIEATGSGREAVRMAEEYVKTEAVDGIYRSFAAANTRESCKRILVNVYLIAGRLRAAFATYEQSKDGDQ